MKNDLDIIKRLYDGEALSGQDAERARCIVIKLSNALYPDTDIERLKRDFARALKS